MIAEGGMNDSRVPLGKSQVSHRGRQICGYAHKPLDTAELHIFHNTLDIGIAILIQVNMGINHGL